MIKVLWIDDECMDATGALTPIGSQFIELAYHQGIEITPIAGYEEGMEAIEAKPFEWSAVILDIREQHTSEDNATTGYNNAILHLVAFQARFRQKEPYIFTLSGDRQYHDDQEAVMHIHEWPHCSKRVYDKTEEDYRLLLNDIRKIESVSELYQFQHKYNDILSTTHEVLGKEAYERLLDIMWHILAENRKNEPELLNEIRKYLEDFITLTLEEMRFFPRGVESLNDQSRFIGDQRDLPRYVKRSFYSLVSVTQEGSHGRTVVDEDVRYGKAPYLLQSCLFELFNIIYWLKELCR